MNRSRDDASFAQWAGLHVTGVLLVLFVTAHLWAVHYASDVSRAGYRFAEVRSRMEGFFYPPASLSLLFLALGHGLVGMHRFIADLGICGARTLRVVAGLLLGAGLWGLYHGIRLFLAFSS